MSVYVIAVSNITNQEEYALYARGFMQIFSKHQGKILSVEGEPTVKEGEWPYEKTVLMEFPSKEAYDLFYHSAEYQALAQHRMNASHSSLVVIKSLR